MCNIQIGKQNSLETAKGNMSFCSVAKYGQIFLLLVTVFSTESIKTLCQTESLLECFLSFYN